jgi:hypothetical protein
MKIISANDLIEGPGVRVKRLFSVDGCFHDPFVLLDEFFIEPLAGLPPHPHRGFEVVTCLIDGGLRHEDDIGNRVELWPGDVQWFSSGRGIVHSESPIGTARSHGIQVWVALPGTARKIAPRYSFMRKESVPQSRCDGAVIDHIVGEGSPLVMKSGIIMFHISIEPRSRFVLSMSRGMTHFVYVYQGMVRIKGLAISKGGGAVFSTDEDSEECPKPVEWIVTENMPAKVLFCKGLPGNEPIGLNNVFFD